MASATRTIHVHDAEISTEQDSLRDYAEALAWMVAVVALLASMWLAARPREDADVAYPDTSPTPQGQFVLQPSGEAYQPEVVGPEEVAVFVPGGAASATPTATSGATFGAPFG